MDSNKKQLSLSLPSTSFSPFISTEEMGAIAEAPNFSGFFTASEIKNAIGPNPSMNLSLVLENETNGNILRSQEQFEEPQGNSTLLDSAEESVELVEDGDTETLAGREGSKPTQVSKEEKKRIRQRLYRQRKKMTDRLSKLSTDTNGQGNQDSAASGSTIMEAEPRNPQPLRQANSIAAKRGRTSPGENPETKRVRRREETQLGLSPYLETTQMNLFLSIIPLDSGGNRIRATGGDQKFLMKVIEQFISDKNPKIDIAGLSFKDGDLQLKGRNQKTLEVVKKMVCLLKGPGNNLNGYLCLAPEVKPPLTTYYVWVKNPLITKKQFINLLKDVNSWIDPKKLTVKSDIPKQGGSTFVVGVEMEIKTELEKKDFVLRYGVGRTAIFKEKSKGKLTRGGEAPQI